MYDNVVVVGICSRTFFYEKAGVRILRMTETESKLAIAAAGFLGKQMEQ